jgi:DNA-binding MarR family transcriptional regulator
MSDVATRPATGEGEDFGRELGVLLRSYRDIVAPVLSDFPQGARGYQTLCEVVNGNQPSQWALANRLGIDRTVMTYLVDDLEKAGLVERRPNVQDRRQRQVVATSKGRSTLAKLCTQVGKAEDAILGTLDKTERATFRRLLNKATRGGEGIDDPCRELADETVP